MATTPVENKTEFPKHVAGTIIPPGETRFFEESELPPYLRKQKAKAPSAEAEKSGSELLQDASALETQMLTDLLGNPVKEVKKALHTLTLDQLNKLDVMEQAVGNRSSLIKDITSERLRRAEIENNTDLTTVEKYVQVHRVG